MNDISRSFPSYTCSSTAWLKVLGDARSPHHKHKTGLRWGPQQEEDLVKVSPTTCGCLFITLRADEHDHSFALEVWYIVGFAVLFEVSGKAREQQFALLFEDDGASAEEDVSFHFIAFLEELLRMFELEVIVMIVGLRTETDLFHLLLLLVSFRLLLLFLLRIEELLVVNNSADRRIGRRRYLDQVEVLLISNMHCLLKRVDALLYIVADEANLSDTADLIVDTMRVLFDDATATRSGSNSCYMLTIIKLITYFSLRHTMPYNRKSVQRYYIFMIYARKFEE